VLEGLAVATDRIEAYVLVAPSAAGDGREVVAIGAEPGAMGTALLPTLLDMVRPAVGRLRVVAITEEDVAFETLARLGFRPADETIGYVASRVRTPAS
jgi:hypothetical protein